MSIIVGPTGFDYAKMFTIQVLDDLLIRHLEDIDNKTPDRNLLNLIIELNVMCELIKKSKGPLFTKEYVNKILIDTLDFLVKWHPSLSKQLDLFLLAHIEIGQMSATHPELPPYSPLKYVESDFERVNNAHTSFVEMIKNFNTPTISTMQLQALLLAFNGKMQTICHAFEKQLFELLKNFGLEQRYDLTDFFYINKKIRRNTIHETDSLAIRDAIAHYKYKIIKTGELWKIEFNNNEKGWNFNETYSYNDFIMFFDNHHKLYIFQLLIIMTIGMDTYLKRYMIK